jgi:transposase
LVLSDGFAVIDSQQRRLHDRARTLGFPDLGSCLVARYQDDASLAQLASELGTTAVVARRLLHDAGLTPPPRRVTAARQRRRTTDQHLAARAAQLGFASLRAYLADRAHTRGWPSSQIASELGVHAATMRDRLDRHRLPRQRATVRPAAAPGRLVP